VLFALQSTIPPLVGIVNVAVYGIDTELRNVLMQHCTQSEDVRSTQETDNIYFEDEHSHLVNSIQRSYVKSDRN